MVEARVGRSIAGGKAVEAMRLAGINRVVAWRMFLQSLRREGFASRI
jgi:hypothetical protein